MKKLVIVSLLALTMFGLERLTVSPASAGVPMMFPDGIETAGIVKRINMYMVFCDWIDDVYQCEWHYFGTDPATSPPPAGWEHWPIVEHSYIQFPEDLDELSGPEANQLLYEMGGIVARRLSGWETPQ